MSVIKGLGWNEPAIATEEGWVSKSGELLVSSRNLLTNRVLQGFASVEEINRWVELKLFEVSSRREKILSAKSENQKRLADIQKKFEEDNAELKAAAESNIESQIEYLQKKVELTRLEGEYQKSFVAADEELKRLDEREAKVKAYEIAPEKSDLIKAKNKAKEEAKKLDKKLSEKEETVSDAKDEVKVEESDDTKEVELDNQDEVKTDEAKVEEVKPEPETEEADEEKVEEVKPKKKRGKNKDK